jgi:nitrate/nitrite-specific signal transduction histidine kinase
VKDKEKETLKDVFNQGQELLEALQRGRSFTEEILNENQRLRMQVVKGESELMQLRSGMTTLTAVQNENAALQQRIEHLERRFGEVEAENHDFASRYAEISEVNESLASLYVATHRLHSTLDPADVTEIICEILIELVGAEDFGLLLLDERTNELALARVEGPATVYPAHILMGDGPIGRAVRECRPTYQEGSEHAAEPLAIVPLQIKGHGVGAIVVTRLLHRKTRLNGLAKELLALLANHAASALTASRLYTSVDRKLRTIEGFMEMMKKPQPQSRA